MRNYGPTGSFGGNGISLPEHQNISKGKYGVQRALLHKSDYPSRINTYINYNYPSPYQNPLLNYGLGPQISNLGEEILDTQFDTLIKDPILREPTKNNPFMNVMPMDYDSPQLFTDYYHYENDNNKRSLEIRNEVKNTFEDGLIQNADSLLWNRLNSQRQFVSMPVGSVPSNQGEFANFLYGIKNNCKAGSIFQHYGVKYTDDSLLCNGYNAAEPTNFGLLNGNFMSSVEKN